MFKQPSLSPFEKTFLTSGAGFHVADVNTDSNLHD